MTKTAIGLFEVSTKTDEVVAHLSASGLARDEGKLVRQSDYDGTPGPETDILKIGGLSREHAGRYWEAVRQGRVMVAVTSSRNARLNLQRALVSTSIRPLIRAFIPEGRQRNSSRFHKGRPPVDSIL